MVAKHDICAFSGHSRPNRTRRRNSDKSGMSCHNGRFVHFGL